MWLRVIALFAAGIYIIYELFCFASVDNDDKWEEDDDPYYALGILHTILDPYSI